MPRSSSLSASPSASFLVSRISAILPEAQSHQYVLLDSKIGNLGGHGRFLPDGTAINDKEIHYNGEVHICFLNRECQMTDE